MLIPFRCRSGRVLAAGVVALAWTLAAPGIARAQAAPEPVIGLDPLAQHYELGHGLRLGRSGFTLGGYGEASYVDLRDRAAQAAVDELSGILWWDGGGRWHFFSELELDRPVVLGPREHDDEDSHVVLERVYFDYVHTDALKLRLGKFLTPIGRWNLIHAAPLTWTTSRPLITQATFPTNASGAMIYGVLPWTADGIEYSLYVAPGEEIFPEQGLDTFNEAYGARVAATLLPHTQVGLSYATFEQEQAADERKNLLGVDFAWSWRRFELSGEVEYRSVDLGEKTRDERGQYLQLVAPLSQHLYVVARGESFHASGADRDLNLYLGGLTYRWSSALVFKAEYSRATDNQIGVPDGLRSSIAVLF